MKHVAYKKILVTHDGSKLASSALPHAAHLAIACKAEIVLLHVVETIGQEMISMNSMGMYPYSTIPAETAQEVVKEDEKLAKEHLEKLKTSLEENGVKTVTTLVANGFAGAEIVVAAKEQHCDLIIISTHGRSGLGRMLLGSVADDVIRHAKCPVLTVHPTSSV